MLIKNLARLGYAKSLRRFTMLLALCSALCFAADSVSAQSEDLAEALRLNAQVELLYRAGRYDEAVPLAERVLKIREKALGAEHPDVATSLTKGTYRRKNDH